MLGELHIRGIGGIRSAMMEFGPGLIAITGESGSGKSSIVRALEFLSGRRAQTSLIRAGCDEAIVEAQFLLDVLPEGDLEGELRPQEGTWIALRALNRSGRGRCRIQGKLAPISLLSRATLRVLLIQSQFSQLALLSPDEQREQLDACGGEAIARLKADLGRALSEAIATERHLRELQGRKKELTTKHEGGERRIQEARALGLFPGCEEEWTEELRGLELLRRRMEHLKEASIRMRGSGTLPGLLDELREIVAKLVPFLNEEGDLEARAETDLLLRTADSLSRRIGDALRGQSQGDLEERIEEIERRLGSLRRLRRETRTASAEELLDHLRECEMEMRWLQGAGAELEGIQKRSETLRRELGSLALALRRKRRETATTLAARVEERLRSLGMESIRFFVEVLPQEKVRSNGADQVEFLLASGEGNPAPVRNIASGGELSRVVLALQACLPEEQLPSVLVFDEVEAGLGGRSALLAGLLLRELARGRQVLLITHEANIAALADQQFVVSREGDETRVVEVRGEERVGEVARMLSGDPEAPEAREHARKLLDRGMPG